MSTGARHNPLDRPLAMCREIGGRRQVCGSAAICGKSYWLSLVELTPHSINTGALCEFMAFPQTKSGDVNFNNPVYERSFVPHRWGDQVDFPTWQKLFKGFEKYLKAKQEEAEKYD